jgi:hypothetical protein
MVLGEINYLFISPNFCKHSILLFATGNEWYGKTMNHMLTFCFHVFSVCERLNKIATNVCGTSDEFVGRHKGGGQENTAGGNKPLI